MDEGRGDELVRHTYVHVPFCPQICPFCSFHVLRRRPGVVSAYLERLDAEAALAAANYDIAPESTYLGGGTPSHLRLDELDRLLASLRRRFGTLGDEVTLEVHPSTATPERFSAWRDLGINRFSVGVESTDDAVLGRLGRMHTAAQGLAAVEGARAAAAGHEVVVSVDLMVAIDGQDIVAELERVASLGVDHVSCYTLTIEAGTPFDRAGVVVDEEVAADAFAAATEVLSAAGLPRYEVSNHARPGAECRHNRAYWQSEWWLGLGPSAAAHLPPPPRSVGERRQPLSGFTHRSPGIRAVNPALDRWLAGESPDVEVLEPEAWVADALVAGLRLVAGVDLDTLAARGGFDVGATYAEQISSLVADGLVSVDTRSGGTVLAATPAGLPILDRVTARLLAPPICE